MTPANPIVNASSRNSANSSGATIGPPGGVAPTAVTAPGAPVAADQERGLAVLPAFEDVRAAGFLAHSVQAFARDQFLERQVLRAGAQSRLDPRRLLFDRRLAVSCFQPEQPPILGHDNHAATLLARGRQGGTPFRSVAAVITRSVVSARRPCLTYLAFCLI